MANVCASFVLTTSRLLFAGLPTWWDSNHAECEERIDDEAFVLTKLVLAQMLQQNDSVFSRLVQGHFEAGFRFR
jgi:hypothetical protein